MQKILDRLARVRRTKDGYKAICPFHSERTPSLMISQIFDEEDKTYKIGLKCFGMDCKPRDIVESIGLKMSDLFIKESSEMTAVVTAKEKGKKYKSMDEIKAGFKTLVEAYPYNWLGEEPSILQVRYLDKNGDKQFATYHQDEDGFWYAGKPEGLLPVYNIDVVNKSKSILIVEGEKVVNLLKEYNIPATTSLGGSNAAETTDWKILVDKPSVVMWRDFDDAGMKYQQTVDNILRKLDVNLRKVDVEKFVSEKGDDLEQFIMKNPGTIDQVRGKIYSCVPKMESIKPINYLKSHLEKVKKGDIKNLPVKFFPMLTRAVRMFKPGSQSVLVSAGGVGKSLFVGRTSDEFTLDKVARVKRLMLESPMSFHLTRSLAQQARMTEVMNEEFHYDNPKMSDEIIEQYEDVLNIIGDTITTSDSGSKKQITEWDAQGVARWMETNAPHNDVLIIDPVSIVLGDSPWLTSTMLTKKAEELMAKYPTLCIVWIQHTAESSSGGNIGGIAGGKAWNRYTSAILEMIMLEDPEMYEIQPSLDSQDTIVKEVKTFIKVKKARNGQGNGWKIAIEIDTDDLTYKEVGRMLRKRKD